MKADKTFMFNILGAIITPVLFSTFYIVLSRNYFQVHNCIGDYLAFGVSLFIGVLFLWQTHFSSLKKFIFSIIFLTCEGYGLFFFSMHFVCPVIGECLYAGGNTGPTTPADGITHCL
jgi:hypothetical protein